MVVRSSEKVELSAIIGHPGSVCGGSSPSDVKTNVHEDHAQSTGQTSDRARRSNGQGGTPGKDWSPVGGSPSNSIRKMNEKDNKLTSGKEKNTSL